MNTANVPLFVSNILKIVKSRSHWIPVDIVDVKLILLVPKTWDVKNLFIDSDIVLSRINSSDGILSVSKSENNRIIRTMDGKVTKRFSTYGLFDFT